MPIEKKKLKLLVIGLDGGNFNVILPLIRKSRLKTLKKLMHDGTYGELRSTIPPISSPAWTSFMTGQSPGNHGIFGFVNYDLQRYDGFLRGRVVTSSSFAGSTFYDILSSKGYRIGVITVPMTYPPWSINGIMISGYPCPYTKRIYCCSEEMKIEFNERLLHGRERHDSEKEEISDIFKVMKRRTEIAVELTSKMNLDCLVIVFGATDRIQHFYGVSNHPVVEKCYEIADKQITKLLKLTDENTTIFVISDHGAEPYPQIVFNTNCWLKEADLLVLNEQKAKAFALLRDSYHRSFNLVNRMSSRFEKFLLPFDRLKESISKSSGIYTGSINWKETKAFRYPMPATQAEGIIINVRGRQETGIVRKGREYERLRTEIIRKLKQMKDPQTGDKIVKTCHRKEDVYSGVSIDKAPDIILQFNKQYVPGDGLSEVFTQVSASTLQNLKIVHSMNGILMAKSSVIKAGGKIEDASIIDLAPTILYSMGIPIPGNMDGRILSDIFTDRYKLERKPKYVSKEVPERKHDSELTEKEKEEIKERLKSLGYI